MAGKGDPFEHERIQGGQYELIGYLSRSAWALGAGGILLVLSGTFANDGGPSLTLMTGAGALLLVLAVFFHRYARRLDQRRKGVDPGTKGPELR